MVQVYGLGLWVAGIGVQGWLSTSLHGRRPS